MREITHSVYQFDELSDKAKEKAREWFRRVSEGDTFWSEATLEDAERMAGILGITIKKDRKGEPAIYYSGFWSQGDGACLEGTYEYIPGMASTIAQEAPPESSVENGRLHEIAVTLENLGPLTATIVKQSHHYSHENTVAIEVASMDEDGTVPPEVAKDLSEALKSFMRWIYRSLEAAYEDSVSNETVDENIRANEYEFFADGRRGCE